MDASALSVPDGFTLHTENNTHILLTSNEAFLNPIQEFNRDLSVACIRVWSELLDKEKETKWRQMKEKKALKAQNKKRKSTSFLCPSVKPDFNAQPTLLSHLPLRQTQYVSVSYVSLPPIRFYSK